MYAESGLKMHIAFSIMPIEWGNYFKMVFQFSDIFQGLFFSSFTLQL